MINSVYRVEYSSKKLFEVVGEMLNFDLHVVHVVLSFKPLGERPDDKEDPEEYCFGFFDSVVDNRPACFFFFDLKSSKARVVLQCRLDISPDIRSCEVLELQLGGLSIISIPVHNILSVGYTKLDVWRCSQTVED